MKLTRKLFLYFGLAVVGLAFSAKSKAQSITDDKESARIFVQKFYDWYSALSDAEVPGEKKQISPQQVLMKQREKYFDARLGKALSDYYNTPIKNDEVGIDFDPFLNGQDTGPTYHACNIVQSGDKFTVELRDIKKGQSEKKSAATTLLLIAEVKRINNQWRFTNFLYPLKAGDRNLLSMLKDQKKK
jgi:hypothetical protein